MAAMSGKPTTKIAEEPPSDPNALRMYSVHLKSDTKGPRRRSVNLGNRGKFAFDADITGKENKKLAGYPHHRIRLTEAEARQFANDGFAVRPLSAEEIAEAKVSPTAAALDQAVAEAKAKAKE